MIEAIEGFFMESFGNRPEVIARAPGRVNLIGEHTDYNDGFVLPCAISRQTLVAVRRRGDRTVNAVSADLGGLQCSFSLDMPIMADPAGGWANYLRGMADGLLGMGLDLPGADIAILGDMPQGAGLSSSAALENATGLALATLAGCEIDRKALALLGQRAEHRFAGCQCGIMDQLVSASAVAGSAMLIDCRSLESRKVPLPEDAAILIVHSGVRRGLVEGEYNLRRSQCEAAAWHFGVLALRDLPNLPPRRDLDEVSYARARHVVSENARVHAMTDAIGTADYAAIAALMAASHQSMAVDFAITTPEIDRLAAIMQSAAGNDGGARMTGGGFGGAVVALVRATALPRLQRAVGRNYRTPDGAIPLMMAETAGEGASQIRVG